MTIRSGWWSEGAFTHTLISIYEGPRAMVWLREGSNKAGNVPTLDRWNIRLLLSLTVTAPPPPKKKNPNKQTKTHHRLTSNAQQHRRIGRHVRSSPSVFQHLENRSAPPRPPQHTAQWKNNSPPGRTINKHCTQNVKYLVLRFHTSRDC